jgi:hypothetical protein
VAFRTEELSIQIFPTTGEGLWACPESTIPKKDPCPQNTHVPPHPGPQPCPANTHPDGNPCPESTIAPTHSPHSPRQAASHALPLLQAQLRERLARGAAEAAL